MAIVIDILLLALCGFLVIYPFFIKSTDETKRTASLKEKLLRDKEAIFKTLSEIEFDYHMGKIAREDYEELKSRYVKEASLVIKAYNELLKDKKQSNLEDKTQVERDIEKEIEEELKRLRNKKRRG
ncbi:hypothetical protein ciss_17980 [Carboxydothermus islandicus]|uniref:Uncharacterized protein n=1 Tax=Carboxydothermus islandicus TaxID=661089 RepID=A0A1L8D3U9_9THEO|nr:hypothetical protein [Carboxydothermus islandicus]GAV25865.1 hypothetical protein ciss_17980 [Carboxydothermus islandicus]